MLIQIDKLKRRPRQIDVAEQANSFPVLAELEAEGSFVFREKITGSLEATWVGDMVKVSGSLATRVTSPCCRCLSPVSEPVDLSVLLTYVNREEGETDLDEELELQGDDLGLIYFSGTDIDLQPDVEQEIIMALPQQPLCKEACKGLCLSCGCNLNQKTCDCEPPILHAGLEALKNFKVKS